MCKGPLFEDLKPIEGAAVGLVSEVWSCVVVVLTTEATPEVVKEKKVVVSQSLLPFSQGNVRKA